MQHNYFIKLRDMFQEKLVSVDDPGLRLDLKELVSEIANEMDELEKRIRALEKQSGN